MFSMKVWMKMLLAALLVLACVQDKEQTETVTVESIALNELQLPTTKLSDIVVNADCGADNSCLFLSGWLLRISLRVACRAIVVRMVSVLASRDLHASRERSVLKLKHFLLAIL